MDNERFAIDFDHVIEKSISSCILHGDERRRVWKWHSDELASNVVVFVTQSFDGRLQHEESMFFNLRVQSGVFEFVIVQIAVAVFVNLP